MVGKSEAFAEYALMPGRAGNRLLQALPDHVFSLLEPDLKQMMLPPGSQCFAAGDPIDQVYFPQTGMISLQITSSDGEAVEISSIGREGAVGLQIGLGYRLSLTRAVVQIAGKFAVISASRFEHAVTRSPALRDLISRYIELSWAEAQQIAACNAIHDSSSRLCRWLLQCADRIGSEHLALTQESMSEMIGVRRTTVTLLAQELQKKGVIRYSRGKIVLMDRHLLETHACECYQLTKHDNLLQKVGIKL